MSSTTTLNSPDISQPPKKFNRPFTYTRVICGTCGIEFQGIHEMFHHVRDDHIRVHHVRAGAALEGTDCEEPCNLCSTGSEFEQG
jgi:hypothetical protein